MRRILTDEEVGVISTGGTGVGGGGTPPSLYNPKYCTLTWTHTDTNDASLFKGFRLALFTGTDPNDTSKYLIAPIETGPAERGAVVTVMVQATTVINAAIQALYTDGNESSWRQLGGAVSVDPNTIQLATKPMNDVVSAAAATAQTTANTAQTTANTATTNINQINSADYLANADKIQLMQDWTAEQATQTQLQTQANSLSVSHTNYDAAVTAIDTYLSTTLGYTTWKTTWPDSTTSGPVTGVLNTLRGYWNTVATQRAALQLGISNQQAVAQGNAATAAAATDATNKSNAVAITVPKTVTGLPALPDATNYPNGRLIYETGTKKVYRSTGSAWEAAAATVAPTDITGQLTATQVPTLQNLSGAITSSQIAASAIDQTKMASGLRVPVIVSALPALPSASYPQGSMVTLTTDNKLYRSTGSTWTTAVATTDLSGTISDAQIAGMAASKVSGTLSDSQLAAISAAKVTGQIVGTQITDGAISTAKLAAGAVTAATIAAGTITSAQIAAGTISASNIASSTITASQIAAGTILTSNIAAGTITGDRLAANTITASQIAADTITAGQIAAGAIGATEVAAGAITTNKLFITGSGSNLNPDPWCQDSTAWISGGGGVNVFLTGIPDLQGGTTAIANTNGASSLPIFANYIPLDSAKNYRLDLWLKTVAGTGGTCYLGVVWYDANKVQLSSNIAQPTGAGSPAGWSNGTYSYFGLTNQAPPTSWTSYGISFGPGETAKVPTNARYMRVGLLLNYNATAGSQIAATGIYLREKADGNLIVDGAITASKIAANTITSNQVAARGITAASLSVANFDNLIPNPNSEQPAPAGGWPAGSYEAAGLVNVGGTGGNYQRFVGNAWTQITPNIPCKPGDQFYFECMALGDDGVSQAQATVDFLDANGTWITGVYPATSNAAAWVKLTTSPTAPANSAFLRVMIHNNTPGKYAHFDDFYLRRMNEGKLIVDGAIQTNHMTANTISGDRISANSLDASKIVADSITAGQIAAGAIGVNELAAGSIVASKMSMISASLVADSCFQSGPAGWTGHTGVTIPGSSLDSCPGPYASQFNSRDCPSKTPIPVRAGEKYFCSIVGYAYGGGGGGGFGILVYGYNRSGAVVEAYSLASTTNTTGWALVSGTITVGATTVALSVGPWMDIGGGWVSANGGPLFTNMTLRKMNDASLIVDGAITANKILAGEIRSTAPAYVQDGSGNATAGFKLGNDGSDITPRAAKFASGDIRIGSRDFTDYWFRLLQAIDGTTSSGRVVLRGNNDVTTLSGAPNIDAFNIYWKTFDALDTGYAGLFRFYWKLQPLALTDNLDSMRYMKADLYPQAGGASPSDTLYATLSDRLYANLTDSNAANAAYGEFIWQWRGTTNGTFYYNASPYPFYGHMLVTIYNVYGGSAQRWFHGGSSLVSGSALTRDTTPPSGAPASGGGGGGGGVGGGCPAPWVKINLASGLLVDAGDLYNGAQLKGVNDSTLEPMNGTVSDYKKIWKSRVEIVLEDGTSTVFSKDHRVSVIERGWVVVQDLKPGDFIIAERPALVREIHPYADGIVCSFVVDGSHTYFSDGLLSHNLKQLN